MNSKQIDIITTSIEAAVEPELWNKTIDLLVDCFGAKSGAILVLDPKHENRLALAMAKFYRVDEFEVFSKFMQREDADDSHILEKVFSLKDNAICSEYELFEVDQYNDLPQSSFRDWLKDQFDISQRYGLKLNPHGPWLDALILHNDAKKNCFSSNEKQEINQLSKVLSSSLKSFRVMEQLRNQFNATLSALDHLGIASFLTRENAQVIHKNIAAQNIIAAADGLVLDVAGRLCAQDSLLSDEISTKCQQIFLTANSENIISDAVISINRPSKKAPYLMIISPVIDVHAELEAGLKCALVFIIDSTETKIISVDGLVKLGHLTPAEKDICRLLIQGLTTEQIMQQRDVSKNTIRQQIKVTLKKLNCNSRIELLRLAIDTRLPINTSIK